MSTNQSSFGFEFFDSVVSLRSAFASCNPELLLDVLLDVEAGWGISYRDIGLNAKESLLEKLSSTIALMCSVDDKSQCADIGKLSYSFMNIHANFVKPKSGLIRDVDGEIVFKPDGMIVPCETFEVSSDGRYFLRRLDAKLIDCSKLKDAKSVLREFGGKIVLSSSCLSSARSLNGFNPFELSSETGLLKDIDVLEEEPWSVLLQRKIWLPRMLCERERYCILASVFWMITYNGFFGNAAEKILGKQSVEYIEPAAFQEFDSEYGNRMHEVASVLNYNSWADLTEKLILLCNEDDSKNDVS